jgi:hypothetical protein
MQITSNNVHNYTELSEYVQQYNQGLCTTTELVFKCFDAGWHVQTTNQLGTTLIRDNPDGSTVLCDGITFPDTQTLYINHL